jgi:hypothetical protein
LVYQVYFSSFSLKPSSTAWMMHSLFRV